MRVRAIVAVGSAFALSCAPGQVVFHVDTDALVPSLEAVAPGSRPPWLFDRLSIDVRMESAGGSTSVSRRDFPVDEEMFREQRVSFGVVADVGSVAAVKLRLFRSDLAVAGEVPAVAAIERTYRVPPVLEAGVRHVHGFLAVDEVGLPIGADAPIEPEEGPPAESRVGTWPGANATACEGQRWPEEVCVPGGAFWLGDPSLPNAGGPPRLVVVSPYFMDRREVTVGDVRKHRRQLEEFSVSFPMPWSGTIDSSNNASYCTWPRTPDESDRDRLPVNCVEWITAHSFCALLGKQLPSEAQFEFVASGRGREWPFPWGTDEPSCEEAVFARGAAPYAIPEHCRPAASIGGPVEAGTGTHDRVPIIDPVDGVERELLDLGGNLGELSVDTWRTQGIAEDARPGVLHDPMAADTMDLEAPHTVRGGSWAERALDTRAAHRWQLPSPARGSWVGFRCARPATP